MYRSYLKVGWRNLIKNKGYSFINIGGLALGMTVAIFIGLWVADELSFDASYGNKDRLVQVMVNQTIQGETYSEVIASAAAADPLRTRYGSDFEAVSLASWPNDHTLASGETKINCLGRWVEPEFVGMFGVKILPGGSMTLDDPSAMLISRTLARSLFGDDDPLNKTVRLNGEQDMRVAGTYEDFPKNSTFNVTQILLPWSNKANWNNTVTEWDNHHCQLFALLADGTDIASVNAKIKNLPTPFIKAWREELMLYPLARLHLYGEFRNGHVIGGRIEFVWLFGIIGAFVLLLACINFMNLATARSEKRSKEVGIRKTIGSVRGQLIGQFLTESIVVVLVAAVLSLVIVEFMLPFFNVLADKQVFVPWGSPLFWILLLSFAFITGVVSGSYPAFYLSSFRPVKVLKGTYRGGRSGSLSRQVLVVVQFTISVTLIIGTLVVFRQIQFAKDRPAGYTRNGLLTININTPDLQGRYDVIRNDLLQTGVVENMAESSHSPAHFSNNTSIEWPGKDPSAVVFFRNVNVTSDFGKTVGWTVENGRDFSRDIPSDSSAVIVNKAAMKIMSLPTTVGERVKYDGKDYTIIGVVDDMVTQSPFEPAEPTIFFQSGWLGVIDIRVKSGVPVREALTRIEEVFKKYNPSAPFEFSFVDQVYGRKFSREEHIGKLSSLFATLAIVISCLGLFGLASFMAEQRTKEIGIRKVMGASPANLWTMLSRDFVVLVIISCLIATPVSYLFASDWLQKYQYRAAIPWSGFLAACAGALLITLVTVSYQTIKAALSNPVTSLRSE